MGKSAKSSRKGKKAWRTNISTEDIEDFYEKSTKDALSGGSLTQVPSESLFFVDKSTDLAVRRKIEKHREKVLHCDRVLQKNAFVQPVPSSTMKKSKKKQKEVQIVKDTNQNTSKDANGMTDLWDDKGEKYVSSKKMCKPSIIPAVEIDPSGCSFNPSSESHQDALALAVADEMQKIYQTELGPKPVPLTVPGEAVNEEDMYFLDADNGNDDDDGLNENPDGDADLEGENKSTKPKRVTRVQLNKRVRHKEQLKKKTEAQKVELLSKEIDSLPDIMKEIAKEDEEKQKRHDRRRVSKQERLETRPPRFGKHKFVPAPAQVLLSEEITGSLRKLKGCCTLARDRFKSFEKRGLIVPTAKSSRRREIRNFTADEPSNMLGESEEPSNTLGEAEEPSVLIEAAI